MTALSLNVIPSKTYFYESYFLDENELDKRISNLCFNLTVDEIARGLESKHTEKTKNFVGNTLVVGIGKVKNKAVETGLKLSATAILTPLGFDPVMIDATVKHLVMPSIPKSSAQDNITNAQQILDVTESVLDQTGANSLLGMINQYGAKAFATLAARKLEEEGKLDDLKQRLKNQSLEVFHTSYLSVNFIEVGFLQGWKNVASNVWSFFCGVLCEIHRSTEEPNLTHLFQKVLENEEIERDIPQVSDFLQMEITVQKYWNAAEKALKAAIAGKNVVSAAGNAVYNGFSEAIGSLF